MKKSLFLGVVCAALICGHAVAGNYILNIDGKKLEVDVDKPAAVVLSDGRTIKVTLEKKAIVSFDSDNFSFDHPSETTPARTDLGGGIYQTMMTTPIGTMILIQEYTTMDPSSLVDMMLNEITKEERQYGYTFKNSPATVALGSGKTLTGTKSIAAYRGEQMTRHVLCYAIPDAGIMVITQEDKTAPPNDRAMIDTFWKTLKITLK